jgi:hypothetical protein
MSESYKLKVLIQYEWKVSNCDLQKDYAGKSIISLAAYKHFANMNTDFFPMVLSLTHYFK